MVFQNRIKKLILPVYQMNMTIKKQLKKIISLLPEAWNRKIYRASAGSFGQGHTPIYHVYHHISNLRRLGFKPELIIDAGAYIGEWTENVRKIFPESTFVMVEAQASKQNVLQEITRKYENVNLEMALLGDAERDNVEFFEMETGSSIYEENTHYDRKKVNLKMRTLDAVAEKYPVRGSCFIKMDVQGAEIDILKGASKLLKNTNFILLEVSTLNYNENAPEFAEVVKFMKDIGYVLFDICDEHRILENQVLFQIDLIFAKESADIRKAVDFKKQAKI